MADAASNLGCVHVDLGALRANYRTLAGAAAPARCAAVVKADAYGLGASPAARALEAAGCRDFFVAHLEEAFAIRPALSPASTIYILNGVAAGAEAACAEAGFIPVLSAPEQCAAWAAFAQARGAPAPAALQIDTGMSRLGLDQADIEALARDRHFHGFAPLRLLMTHLACADAPTHPANEAQLAAFNRARALFPGTPGSISNSGGVFLGPAFHADLARAGIALYGAAPSQLTPALARVATLDAPVLQIREIAAGVGVGYGLDFVAPSPRRIATIGVGYGDGWPRNLGGRGAAWRDGVRLPIIGRVSMDSMGLDISALPADALAVGDRVELIGADQSLEDIAAAAGTISYEILTRLGPRLTRIYLNQEAASA